MQINHPSWYRALAHGRPMFASLFAIAVAVAIAAPASAQTPDSANPINADDGRARLLTVVPADPAQTSAAAAIADLAAKAQPEAPADTANDAAVAAQAVPAETAEPAAVVAEEKVAPAADVAVVETKPVEQDPLVTALTEVNSPTDLYENLIAAGYQVEIVYVGQTNSTFLVKQTATSAGVLLLVDAHNGKVLSHGSTEGGGYVHHYRQAAQGYSPANNGYYHPPVGYYPPAGYGYNSPAGYGYTGQYGGY